MVKVLCSKENPTVKQVAKLVASRSQRKKENLFVCEGFVLLEEALRSGLAVQQVFCLEDRLEKLPAGLSCDVFAVTPAVLQRISDVEQPQGVVFTCRMPAQRGGLSGSRFLALDNLRDPGNLGTILRSAEAFGLDGVVLLGDCVDLWAPKTLRSAMGSAFRVPVYRFADAAELKAQLAERGVPMYAAALHRDSRSVVDTDLHRACVVIGNEAHGVGEATLAACDASLIIPIHTAESLNAAVAAAVFAWEMSRQSMEARG